MHTPTENEVEKEFVSTVVPFKDLQHYIVLGYESVGTSFFEDVRLSDYSVRRVRKITVRKRIGQGI